MAMHVSPESHTFSQKVLTCRWLCHADARQVFDLPDIDSKNFAVYDRNRQVRDL